MSDLLLEIGCEEIPARMIDSAREELARRIMDVLGRERLAASPQLQPFSTPRRISILARGLSVSQPDVEEQVMGPSYKIAFKDGAATPAATAFAKKVNVDLSQLEKVSTPKGEYVSAKVMKRGRLAREILAEALPKEIAGLYWSKNMYWRGKNAERFVRPVRWLVALLDGEAIPVEFGGVEAGSESEGHRLLSKRNVTISGPASYTQDLLKASVVVDPADRLARIRRALDDATRKVSGASWREDKELLETVVNLTEFPSVILGNFDREFLSLPEEVLVTVMRDHQKYFAVEDASGKLAPHFLAVLNTDGDPDGLIQHGNERVLRARFNDARFFWDTDQKYPLRERVEMLKSVTFQKDLGSYFDKSHRVQALASLICEWINGEGETQVRGGVVHKATLLAKTDLTTELVKEFTELQGIVGGLYARVQQLDPILPDTTRAAIADAIYDQYKPESMEDSVPRTIEGGVLSLADKADSIAGMFALGLIPTGSKDPFALRRQANAIVRIIAEHKLPLSLRQLFAVARREYEGSPAEPKFKDHEYGPQIEAFFRERLEFYLRDVRGFAYDVVSAVLGANSDEVLDALARAEAVAKVRPSEDFESISAAFKRMKNILRQANEKKVRIDEQFSLDVLQDAAERPLAQAVPSTSAQVRKLREQGQYEQALQEIAKLRPVIDQFFDKVMVMVEDERIRANRLALLQAMLNEFSTIADFSEIVTEKK